MSLTRRGFLGLIGSTVAGLSLGSMRVSRVRDRLPFPSWEDSFAQGIGSSLAGHVADILSGRPVLSAVVSAIESTTGAVAATTSASANGYFALSVPSGNYEVRASAAGYLSMSKVRQAVDGASTTTVDFQMIPIDLDEEGERRIYEAVVASPESPLDDLALSNAGFTSEGVHPVMTVPDTIIVDFGGGVTQTMALDDYLKGVVPSEMPASWHPEALKAQAVSARSYAVAYVAAHNGRICPTAACQVYSNTRYDSTNQAVDATHGQIAVYNGSIVWAFYFTKCNAVTTRNSEDAFTSYDKWSTCQPAGWNYVAYCRARPCGGHSPGTSNCGYTGHGVGMCQYGAQARAVSGSNYQQIISAYFTSVTIQSSLAAPTQVSPFDGALVKTGDPITLTWSGLGSQDYYAELTNSSTGATLLSFGWAAGAASWSLGGLGRGTYYWRVKTRVGSNESSFTGYWRIVVTDTIYKTYFPRADKASIGL